MEKDSPSYQDIINKIYGLNKDLLKTDDIYKKLESRGVKIEHI